MHVKSHPERLLKARRLLSEEHFSVDSTLSDSRASLKSLKKDGQPPKDGGDGTGMVGFKGERRGSGQPAKLCFGGHALMENRSGRCVDLQISDSRTRQRTRTRIEEIFGWLKTAGGLRKSQVIGSRRTPLQAYSLPVPTTCCAWPTWHER